MNREIFFTAPIKVRYADTDKMGGVYYANYFLYYEDARLQTLKQLGIDYGELEDKHFIGLPVREINGCKFYIPLAFDDSLIVKTTIKDLTNYAITFHHQLFIVGNDQIVSEVDIKLAFTNLRTGKLCRCPSEIFLKLSVV